MNGITIANIFEPDWNPTFSDSLLGVKGLQ